MKKFILFIALFLLTGQLTYGQVIYYSKIDSILNLVSVPSISRTNKELSGDTIITIGGISQILYSRYWLAPGNVLAAQYIFEKFQSYGLSAKYMTNNATNVNVYAVKTGTKYPNKKYIIGAHYDDIVFGNVPDIIYGADDNASGICEVLEAARLLANIDLDYTVIFVAFDEEEIGGYGSKAFADSLYLKGDTILGYLNADMIGYHHDNNLKATVISDTNSYGLYNDAYGCNQIYNLGISIYPTFNVQSSDHSSFWNKGYKAISPHEDYGDFNPYYHSLNDRFNKFNVPYFYKLVKLSVSTLLTWALDKRVLMNFIPLNSTRDTSARIAKIYIKAPFNIEAGYNAPRLYYKTDNKSFNFLNAYSINQDTFWFMIPGNPWGSSVSYYFALQNSSGNTAYTLPSGGSGINPPGTTPPPQLFSYSVIGTVYISSNTVPKPTINQEWIKDTIIIQQPGEVLDVNISLNINHTDDGDLLLRLQKKSEYSNLSQFNGAGGQNFTNTIFDDSASVSITQGEPPFSGRFKPQSLLSRFKGKDLTGTWILEIFDKGQDNTGTLLNWTLEIAYTSPITITEKSGTVPEKYSLKQNYPNPFNATTKIKFDIPALKGGQGAETHRGGGMTVLKIYDILGKEIETLVNEKLSPGQYTVTFSANNYASGVYFYRIVSGDFMDTKKLILLK